MVLPEMGICTACILPVMLATHIAGMTSLVASYSDDRADLAMPALHTPMCVLVIWRAGSVKYENKFLYKPR